MFEAWSVSSSFVFTSNARSFFPPLLRQVEKLTGSIDALTAAAQRAGAGVTEFGASIRDGATLIRSAIGSIGAVTGELDALGGSAAANAKKFVSSTVSMSEGMERTATVVSESALAIDRDLGSVRRSAIETAAALAKVKGGPGPVSRAFGGGVKSAMGAAEGVGLVAAVTAGFGLSQASQQQAAIFGIATMQGRSPAQVSADYLPAARAFSNRTGGSVTDALGIAAVVSGIIKDPKELQRALLGSNGQAGILDTVQTMKRQGVEGDPADIARQIVLADHSLNAFSGPDMAKVNNSLFKAVVADHLDLKKFATGLSYWSESARLAMGGRPAAIGDILALSESAYFSSGNGQKWGAGLNQVLRTIEKPSKAQIPYLFKLGLVNADGSLSSAVENSKGELTPVQMLKTVRENLAGMPALAQQQLLQRAFPVNGARTVSDLTSPKAIAFISRLMAAQARMAPIMDIEKMQMQELSSATDRVKKNFENLSAILEGPLVAPLTHFLNSASDTMDAIGKFLTAHRQANAVASGAVAIAGTLAAGAFLKKQILPMFGIGGREAEGVVRGGTSMLSRAGAIGGDLFPIVGRMTAGFRAFGAAIAKVAGPIGRAIGGFSIFGRSLGFLAKGAIPVAGDVYLVVTALKALKDHSFDIGFAIGKAARWLHDTGGPMLGKALEAAFTSAIGYALKSIFPYIRDSIVSNVQDALGIRHKAIGFDATLSDITGGVASGVAAGYGPQPQPAGVTPYDPNALNGNVLVNHGTITIRSNNPKDFYSELMGQSGPALAQHRAAASFAPGSTAMFPSIALSPNGGSGAK